MREKPLSVDRLALRAEADISFELGFGERLFVCGEGGSRLLLALAGFTRQDGGRIVVEGRDVSALPTRLRHLAYIPAGDSLVRGRSAGANLTLAGRDHPDLPRIVPPELSYAVLTATQKRLIALERALRVHPAALLIEEGDDPPAISAALAATPAPASLTATADRALALARADRILLLRDGQVVQAGTPRELFERPADAWTATYFGDCNIIPVQGARLAIRPHALRIGAEGLPAHVARTDYQGSVTRIRLVRDDTELCLDTATPPTLVPGQTVHLSWRPEDAWRLPG